MRCILCDRCKKIVEDERKIKVVSYARPLCAGATNVKCPTRADDRQMNDLIWTKELCSICAEAFENFMIQEDTESSNPPEETGEATE